MVKCLFVHVRILIPLVENRIAQVPIMSLLSAAAYLFTHVSFPNSAPCYWGPNGIETDAFPTPFATMPVLSSPGQVKEQSRDCDDAEKLEKQPRRESAQVVVEPHLGMLAPTSDEAAGGGRDLAGVMQHLTKVALWTFWWCHRKQA